MPRLKGPLGTSGDAHHHTLTQENGLLSLESFPFFASFFGGGVKDKWMLVFGRKERRSTGGGGEGVGGGRDSSQRDGDTRSSGVRLEGHF